MQFLKFVTTELYMLLTEPQPNRCLDFTCCIPRKTYRGCCPGVEVGIEPWVKTCRRKTAHSDK